jgi:hypothetical protein
MTDNFSASFGKSDQTNISVILVTIYELYTCTVKAVLRGHLSEK